MADYTDSKFPPGAQHQENQIESPWGRSEPLLTPELLKSRFLFGIPLVSKFKNPDTNQPFRITDAMLQDYIELAVDEVEVDTGLTIMPTQFFDKLPFQRQDYEQFGYFKLNHRPCSSIDELTVTLADNSQIFKFPTQWIETGNLVYGQLNIIPLVFQSAIAGTGIIGAGPDSGAGPAVFFNSLWNRPWVAALFGVKYTAGFKDGMLPKSVNQLIGIVAAMQVLSQLAATLARSTSQSLGVDGLSQSVGTPGPQTYVQRMTELKEQRALLTKKVKKLFGTKFVMGTV